MTVVFLIVAALSQSADWPEFRGENRDGIWRADGLVENFDGLSDPLPRKWAAPVGGGYSGPTVAGDCVYVLDRKISEDGEWERVVCVDRETGESKWTNAYPCKYEGVDYGYGPRASVTIANGRAYSLGMMGHLHCMDAKSGKVVWKKNLAEVYRIDMPIWGLASSPLVEGGTLVVQVSAPRDGATFVGFDPESGDEKWRVFSDKGSYVSPMAIDQAGKRVTILWSGQRISGIDAETGKPFWEIATPPTRMPINVPGPAFNVDFTKMFLAVFYDGSRLIELGTDVPTAKELWHRQGINERTTDALHCMISPPFFKNEMIYGIDSYGQIRCLDPKDGNRVWENTSTLPQERWSTGFSVQNGERTWIVNERGEIIIANFSREGFHEIDRARLIEPTTPLKQRREGVVLWSHPAFAGTYVFVRNDRELICVDLGE